MAQRRGVIRKIDPVRSVGFDQRRWPVLLALLTLAGTAIAMVVADSTFDDPRPLYNGWFRLAMLALGFASLCTLIFLLDAQLTRRSQLALVLSVICHVLLSGVLYQQYLDLPVVRVADVAAPDPEEQPVVVAEYHARPADERPLAEAFERPQPVRAPDVPAIDAARKEPQARPAEARQQISTLPETEPALEPSPVELRRPLAAASHRAPDPSQLARQMDPATAPWSRPISAPQPREEAGEPIAETLAPQMSPTARREARVRVPKVAALERQLTTQRDAVVEPQTVRVARSELPATASDRSAESPTPIARSAEAAALVATRIATDATTPLAVLSPTLTPAGIATAVRRATPASRSMAESSARVDIPTQLTVVHPPSQRGGASGRLAGDGSGMTASRQPKLRKALAAATVAAEPIAAVAAASGPAGATTARSGDASDAVPVALAVATARQTPPSRGRSDALGSDPIEISTQVNVESPASGGPRQIRGAQHRGAATIAAAASVPRRTAAAGQVGTTQADDIASPSDQTLTAAAGGQAAGPAVSESQPTRLARTTAAGPGRPGTLPETDSSLAAAAGTAPRLLAPSRPRGRRAAAHATQATQLAGGIAGSPHRKTTTASLPGQVVAAVPGIVSLSQYAEVSSPAAETAAGRLGRARGTLLVPAAAALGIGGLATEPSPRAGLPRRKALRESEIVHYRPDKYPQRKFGGPAVASGRARDVAAAFVRRGERQRKISDGGNGRPLPRTEAAIELGLAFLSRQQLPDGHWSFRPAAEGGPGVAAQSGAIQADTAATGLSLLAFLGAGYDHYDDQYQEVVRRGLNYLVDHQQPNGALYRSHQRETDRVAQMYSHGIATIALCEAVGMTGDTALRPAAQRAIDFIVAAQHPQRGGWRYQPRRSSDLSVTGWQLMALKSGELAGMHVPSAAYRNVSAFLDRCRGKGAQRGLFLYNPYASNTPEQRHGRQPSTVMTAIGLLMRLYTGRDRTDPDVQRGAAHLLANLPRIAAPTPTGSLDNPMRDTYYWYHATQVMFHMRGRYWNAWHSALHAVLIDSQVKTGGRAGSWDSRRPVPDRWGYQGGDLLMTAMNLLSLEVTYRHLPIYENTLDRPSKLATAEQ